MHYCVLPLPHHSVKQRLFSCTRRNGIRLDLGINNREREANLVILAYCLRGVDTASPGSSWGGRGLQRFYPFAFV